MTVIYLKEYNTRCYAVNLQNNGCVTVQKFEDISNHENIIYCVEPLEILLGKSEICDMTIMSGALNKAVFDGKTILLKVNEENNKHKYVYIGGDKISSFLTKDIIYKKYFKYGK